MISNNFYMLLVEYMYSIVVPVHLLLPWYKYVTYFGVCCFVIYMSLGPAALCHVNNTATYTSVCNLYTHFVNITAHGECITILEHSIPNCVCLNCSSYATVLWNE